MQRHFDEQLDELRHKLLRLAGLVTEAIRLSVGALVERDSDLAATVMAADDQLDRLEVEIDRLCTGILALQQPMAKDLRFIATAMKITTDLERMGDLAVNVSERVIELNCEPPH